jgi:c-di-GMP-related signal transduction protein
VDVFVARHAIFDRNLALFGYELLYRSCQVNSCPVRDDTTTTLHVLANSLLTSGLEVLACNAPVFINFGEQLLTSQWTSLFPPSSVVIEILESVQPSPEVIAACTELRKLGYLLALDDVVADGRSDGELAAFANFVKVDFRATTREEQAQIAKSFHGTGRRLVAEKVETHEDFDWACSAGYDYFQGFFFAKPTLLKGQNVPSIKVNSLRLLRELQEPELDFNRLQAVIKCDISLAYKLFRYVNSALFARPKPISGILDALIVLGELDVRRWITLATLPGLAAGSIRELMVHALVRARFCEKLAIAANVQPSGDAFLVGMFSLLDALVNRPLSEILLELNLPASIRAPLLGTSGPTGVATVYEIALRYEAGEWDALDALMKHLFLPAQSISDLYIESVTWANEMFNLVGDSSTNASSGRSDLLAMQKAVAGSQKTAADLPRRTLVRN